MRSAQCFWGPKPSSNEGPKPDTHSGSSAIWKANLRFEERRRKWWARRSRRGRARARAPPGSGKKKEREGGRIRAPRQRQSAPSPCPARPRGRERKRARQPRGRERTENILRSLLETKEFSYLICLLCRDPEDEIWVGSVG